jgi:hypothetical protein
MDGRGASTTIRPPRREVEMATSIHSGLRNAVNVKAHGCCPMCGSDSWVGGEDLAVVGAETCIQIEALPFVCTNCGFVRFHAIQALETIDD